MKDDGSAPIAVLMSTHNGERFIVEQIESILQQLPEGGRLQVRDDGSTDETPNIVDTIRDVRVSVTRENNIGYVRSFFRLLASAPANAEIVLLADQDDVWLPDKIERARVGLRGVRGPGLYCSRLWLVDESLRRIGVTQSWPRGPSYHNALAENIVTGCTVALNRQAVQLLLHFGNADRIRFHDWWMYLVISAFGTVVADPEPSVNYRQHGSNAVGYSAGWRRYLLNLRAMRHADWVHSMYSQIENFRSVHGATLAPSQREWLDRYFNPHNPVSVLRLLFGLRRHRQLMIDDLLMRILIAWNLVTGRGLVP